VFVTVDRIHCSKYILEFIMDLLVELAPVVNAIVRRRRRLERVGPAKLCCIVAALVRSRVLEALQRRISCHGVLVRVMDFLGVLERAMFGKGWMCTSHDLPLMRLVEHRTGCPHVIARQVRRAFEENLEYRRSMMLWSGETVCLTNPVSCCDTIFRASRQDEIFASLAPSETEQWRRHSTAACSDCTR
jgi:hypothetical protein